MIRVVCGEDAYLVASAEKRLVESLVDAEWKAVNLTVCDGATAAIPDVINSARTPSFFGNRLVVVRDCPWFTPRSHKKKEEEADPEEKAEADAGSAKPLIELCKEGLPPGCNLLLVVPKALNKTLATTKAMLEAAGKGRAEIQEFPGPNPYRPESTIEWLVGHARTVSAGIDRAAAQALVERLGQDKYLLAAEMQKLGSYARDRAVRVGDVALLSPPGESDVFEVLEAVVARDLPGAIAHLRRLMAHDHPLKILATLATFVRTYWQIKLLAERRTDEEAIASAVKWHPFRVKKALASLGRWNSGHLARALSYLSEAEHALKGSGLPDALVLDRLLAKLASL